MSEKKDSEFDVNPPDLTGKKDNVSRVARGIQSAFGIKPGVKPPEVPITKVPPVSK